MREPRSVLSDLVTELYRISPASPTRNHVEQPLLESRTWGSGYSGLLAQKWHLIPIFRNTSNNLFKIPQSRDVKERVT